ncbi:ribbon-helix-helix protein, CopG family [Aquibium microcysteis]|uniref:ribbon-helix-helix protein, CopG family n=1 Tax=Aquibium microcysteis TaxID=675281 RepID=UPI00165CF5A7|nr:ribbon-helix-helix protein, CopG family [Aquibium microcysteis]
MCARRLEIELNDDLLSRVDRAAARTGRSRGKVVIDALEGHLPRESSADASAIERRLAVLDAVVERAEKLGRQRKQVDIDADLAAIRDDRGHGQ